MHEPAIVVENLSKRYRIGLKEEMHDSLGSAMASWLRTPFSNFKRLKKLTQFDTESTENPDIIWALKDVSFEVQQGEVIGIIGRNGAGKSTLLKILSRITDPSSGRAIINGRVSSLLEVGTGFHQELTGRENIYLNGAILGMSKTEIDRKFDEIVAFSEMETFLDTPVKRYSSGMKVRLAFAVAAHLEPEILLIDEVLAVGDAVFQKKCLGKMNEVAGKGRTVFLVSHNMAAITNLCSRALLIQNGRLTLSGDPADVTSAYLSAHSGTNEDDHIGYRVNSDVLKNADNNDFAFTDVHIINTRSPEAGPRTGDPVTMRFYYRAKKQFIAPAIVVSLRGLFGQEIFRISTNPISNFEIDALYDKGWFELSLDALNLVSGTYFIDLSLVRERVESIVKLESVAELFLAPFDIYESGIELNQSHGIMVVDHQWRHYQS